MFLTVHATFGALVATQTPGPGMALVGGFLSHFLLDFIPHGDEKVGQWILSHKKKFILLAGADITITAFLTAVIATIALSRGDNVMNILFGMFGAVLPDFLSMAFPELHQLFRRNIIIASSYKLLRALSVAQLVAVINGVHHRIHGFFLRRYGFKFSLQNGLLLQTVFLGLVMYVLLGRL